MKTKDLLVALLALVVGIVLGWLIATQQAMPENIEETNGDNTVSQHFPQAQPSSRDYLTGQLLEAGTVAGPINIDSTGGDCNLAGIWDSSTSTCTLTSNIAGTVELNDPGLTLDCKRHKITKIGPTDWPDAAAIDVNADSAIVENCKIVTTNRAYGIRVNFVNNGKFLNNVISSEWTSVFLRGTGPTGNTNHTVKDNTLSLSDGAYGIWAYLRSNDNTIESNTITGGRRGIIIDASHGNTVTRNTVSGQAWEGLELRSRWWSTLASGGATYGNTITDNIFSRSGGPGILIRADWSDSVLDDNSIIGNKIHHSNGDGISLRDATNTEIIRNVITQNAGNGLSLYNSASTEVSLNDIFLNDEYAVYSDADIELSVDGKGNWWHGSCGKGLFTAEEDSNDLLVVDSFPYRGAVAHAPSPSDPDPCPGSQ